MSLKVSRILHAGYFFEFNKTKIIFDPIFENPFSYNCFAYPDVSFDLSEVARLEIDAIFISHFHDDHCSLESLKHLNRTTPIYFFCLHEELFQFIRELGFKSVHPLEIDSTIAINEFSIATRRALDSTVDSIFHIQVAGLNILNVVDSWIDDETLDLLKLCPKWDLILWPFQTMQELQVLSPKRLDFLASEIPIEWIEQLRVLQPKVLVPSSCQFIQEPWSWYRKLFFPISYDFFASQMKAQLEDCKILRMNPGTSFIFDRFGFREVESLPWVKPIAEQNVDYEYDPKFEPMATSEVAKRLPAATFDEVDFVINYCTVNIKEIYQNLEHSEESYFCRERIWKLSLFDRSRPPQTFVFKICAGTIEWIQDSLGEVSWSTEIPIVKFYSALVNAESLTSLYMRVNQDVFSDTIERELQDADILEDPLIRCLYSQGVATYQMVQLKRYFLSLN